MAKSTTLFVSLLLFSLSSALPQAIPAPGNATSADLETCLEGAGVEVIAPADTEWSSVSQAWQLRITTSPTLMAYPTTNAELASALSCALASDTKVSALAGGHSFVAYGYGNDGNLVVDMAAFNSMSFDEATGLLTYGAGNRVGPVAKFAWDGYGVHFPHVRHGRPGLAGSSIGGGFGTTSRFLGTPMDYLESVNYMLYNGTEVTSKAGDDLFFAAQGAGSSFGILTSLTTKTWKPTYQTAINFTLSLGAVSLEVGINSLLAVQEYAVNEAPDEFAIRWSISVSPFSGTGYFYGDPTTFDAALAPLMARLPANASLTKTELGWWAQESAANPGVNLTDGGAPSSRTSYTQSLALTADTPLTYDLAYTLYSEGTYKFNRTDMSRNGYLDLWGGVTKNVKDSDTSYHHGNNLWLIRLDGVSRSTTWPPDGTEYMKALMTPFENALTEANIPLRGFANYRDSALTEAEWSERLYGAENYARLKSIKAAYDPMGMFTNNGQSIGL